jgi:hypothetical protein
MEQIGYLSACIGGDTRYTSTLTVRVDRTTKRVSVQIRESGASGGMDGPGGSYDAGVTFSNDLIDPTPKKLLESVRRAIEYDGVLKRYGRPTKQFEWGSSYPKTRGLNQAHAKAALEAAFS